MDTRLAIVSVVIFIALAAVVWIGSATGIDEDIF
jgi:hypothetical protein